MRQLLVNKTTPGANRTGFRSNRVAKIACGVAAVAAIFLVTGCGSSPNQSAPPSTSATTDVVQQDQATAPATSDTMAPPADSVMVMKDDGTGTLSFGMSLDDFHAAATTLNWTCDPATGVDKNGVVTVGAVTITFLGDNTLAMIKTTDASIQTEQGLVVGDSTDQLYQMYGTNYGDAGMSGDTLYRYTLSSGVQLYVGIDSTGKIVTSWALSLPGT